MTGARTGNFITVQPNRERRQGHLPHRSCAHLLRRPGRQPDSLVSMCESVFGPRLTGDSKAGFAPSWELANLTELKLVAPQPAIDARISLLLAKQRQPASA